MKTFMRTLVGTPKQVKWAESIRDEYLKKLEEMERRADERHGIETVRQASFHREAVSQLRTEALGQTSAAWWIENRGTAIAHFMQRTRDLAAK